jgi:hypothetical protein
LAFAGAADPSCPDVAYAPCCCAGDPSTTHFLAVAGLPAVAFAEAVAGVLGGAGMSVGGDLPAVAGVPAVILVSLLLAGHLSFYNMKI